MVLIITPIWLAVKGIMDHPGSGRVDPDQDLAEKSWRWRITAMTPAGASGQAAIYAACRWHLAVLVKPATPTDPTQCKSTTLAGDWLFLKPKTPPFGGVSCLVEAAGIEPASASPLPLALHAYPRLLI
jgi:hypothetical protein